MNPFIATLVYVTGIAGLFYLDRNASLRASKALWLPVVWISIVGSRAVSVWFNMSPADSDVQMDGSPLDRVVFALLLVGGLVVLVNRGRKSSAALKASWPILAYFAFCLVSVVWSDFPDVAAKRWIKAIGDLVMVLIIVTDGNPNRSTQEGPCACGLHFVARVGSVNQVLSRSGTRIRSLVRDAIGPRCYYQQEHPRCHYVHPLSRSTVACPGVFRAKGQPNRRATW